MSRNDSFFEALKPFLAPDADHAIVRNVLVREVVEAAETTSWPHSVGLEQLAHRIRLGNQGLEKVARALESIQADSSP